MEKSAEAFRTIAEVADTLGVAQHVLRFWEQRFPQVAPVKRAGGRRYYRPADLALLAGLKAMLHDEGLTIRGAQKRLAEDGLAAVQARGSDWLSDRGNALPAPREARRPARKAAAPRLAKAPTPQPASPQPMPQPDAMPAVEDAAPSHSDSPPVANEPPRRAARRAAEDSATLPLFPDLTPAPAADPVPEPRTGLPSRPEATAEAPRYADPIAERLARLTAALRRCDALAEDGPLADDLADELARLARDLRALATKAASGAAPSA